MTAEEFMKKLEAAVCNYSGGVKVWFGYASYEAGREKGQSFVDWASEELDMGHPSSKPITDTDLYDVLKRMSYKQGFKWGVTVALLGVSILGLVWWVGHQ